MQELWPAARSGNADAEELIGVMYAMGLGVEKDDVRAFEWYLRSAMKGHPGAQSALAGITKLAGACPRGSGPGLTLGMCCRRSAATLTRRSARKKS